MKKNLMLVLIVIAAFLVSAVPAFGDSSDDYKVIKNAVKSKGGEPTWFKLTVYDKKAKKVKVTMKFPLALFDMFAECIDEEEIKIKGKKDVTLKKLLKVLKENGPLTLIEIDEEDELVKLWIE